MDQMKEALAHADVSYSVRVPIMSPEVWLHLTTALGVFRNR